MIYSPEKKKKRIGTGSILACGKSGVGFSTASKSCPEDQCRNRFDFLFAWYTRHSQPLQFQKTCFDRWVKIRIYIRHFCIRNNSFPQLHANENGINNIDLPLIDRHQSTSLCRTNQELRLPAYGDSQKNNDIGRAYFFSPLALPPFLLSPSHLPLGLLFLLSPIFHCHKIKDGGYNNTNTNNCFAHPKYACTPG